MSWNLIANIFAVIGLICVFGSVIVNIFAVIVAVAAFIFVFGSIGFLIDYLLEKVKIGSAVLYDYLLEMVKKWQL